jgi:hypothetical protein
LINCGGNTASGLIEVIPAADLISASASLSAPSVIQGPLDSSQDLSPDAVGVHYLTGFHVTVRFPIRYRTVATNEATFVSKK